LYRWRFKAGFHPCILMLESGLMRQLGGGALDGLLFHCAALGLLVFLLGSALLFFLGFAEDFRGPATCGLFRPFAFAAGIF